MKAKTHPHLSSYQNDAKHEKPTLSRTSIGRQTYKQPLFPIHISRPPHRKNLPESPERDENFPISCKGFSSCPQYSVCLRRLRFNSPLYEACVKLTEWSNMTLKIHWTTTLSTTLNNPILPFVVLVPVNKCSTLRKHQVCHLFSLRVAAVGISTLKPRIAKDF